MDPRLEGPLKHKILLWWLKGICVNPKNVLQSEENTSYLVREFRTNLQYVHIFKLKNRVIFGHFTNVTTQ
jgi:hypothetical protein